MKLSSALPEGPDNGLSAIYHQVCRDPEADYLVVAVITGSKLTTDVDTGHVVPTVKVVQVEAITDDELGVEVQRALSRTRAERTGQLSIDTATGQIEGVV